MFYIPEMLPYLSLCCLSQNCMSNFFFFSKFSSKQAKHETTWCERNTFISCVDICHSQRPLVPQNCIINSTQVICLNIQLCTLCSPLLPHISPSNTLYIPSYGSYLLPSIQIVFSRRFFLEKLASN